MLNLGKRFLEQLGYTVLATDTPEAALQLAHEYPDDSSVADRRRNARDERARPSDALLVLRPNIKCLFVSGYTADVIAHHGILEEGVYFLQKPYSIESLSIKLREAMSEQ